MKRNKEPEQLLKNIRKLRKLKQLTQEQIARKIHLERSTYSRYENGTYPLPMDKFFDIAFVLGMEPEELICYPFESKIQSVSNKESQNGLTDQQPGEAFYIHHELKSLTEKVGLLDNKLNRLVDDLDTKAFSIREVQVRLGISYNTVKKLINNQELKVKDTDKKGGRILITARSLQEYLEKREADENQHRKNYKLNFH